MWFVARPRCPGSFVCGAASFFTQQIFLANQLFFSNWSGDFGNVLKHVVETSGNRSVQQVCLTSCMRPQTANDTMHVYIDSMLYEGTNGIVTIFNKRGLTALCRFGINLSTPCWNVMIFMFTRVFIILLHLSNAHGSTRPRHFRNISLAFLYFSLSHALSISRSVSFSPPFR